MLREEKTVSLSSEALAMAIELQKNNADWVELDLRLYLDGKGCDGFYYGVSFDKATDADVRFPHKGLNLIVDNDTIKFVQGAVVNWQDGEQGRGFLVDNPNHNKFRGKFFRKKGWEDGLSQST